jgi:hypothetical protein
MATSLLVTIALLLLHRSSTSGGKPNVANVCAEGYYAPLPRGACARCSRCPPEEAQIIPCEGTQDTVCRPWRNISHRWAAPEGFGDQVPFFLPQWGATWSTGRHMYVFGGSSSPTPGASRTDRSEQVGQAQLTSLHLPTCIQG